MKIVLRNFETGLFLGRDERWTMDPAEALEFCSDFKATEHKCLHRLASTFAVVVDDNIDRR
ncbi:MAG TPA: hypothetical protein VEC99_02950, partial [Clostridia bacterium]|nr:hypothetical protein [Clostridia bacterium]